jgi:hypothetical protein
LREGILAEMTDPKKDKFKDRLVILFSDILLTAKVTTKEFFLKQKEIRTEILGFCLKKTTRKSTLRWEICRKIDLFNAQIEEETNSFSIENSKGIFFFLLFFNF